MRTIWKGAVSFGLVTIPVKLYSATEEKDVAFHQVRRSDGSRIKYKRVAAADGEEVQYADIAKGYELPDGETVVLTDEDFADLPLATQKTVEVLQFVPLEQVDPIYFNKSYYLEPDGQGVKPYVLLAGGARQGRPGGDRQGGPAAAGDPGLPARPGRRPRHVDHALAGRDQEARLRLPGR